MALEETGIHSTSRTGRDLAIYRDVVDAVSGRRLKPGAKLTEDALARIYATSRTTVRRALVRLAHDKIVTLKPNRGAFVSTPSVEEARNVFQARSIIERSVCQLAAQRVRPADLRRLRKLAADAHTAHDRAERGDEVRFSGAFHREIAACGGNPILADMLEELIVRSSLIVALYQPSGEPDCGYEEHLQILDALGAGNGDLAADLMSDHLMKLEERLFAPTPAQRGLDLASILNPKS